MGTSTDGMLYFGIDLGDDSPGWLIDENDDLMEFEEFLCRRAGVDPETTSWEQQDEIASKCPAILQMYCSYDYPMYILGIRGYKYSASRGSVVEITPESLTVKEEDIAAFKKWCDSVGIEYQEPKWHLCSMWG